MNFSKTLHSGKRVEPISPNQLRKQKLQTLLKQAATPKRIRDNLVEKLVAFNEITEVEPDKK